jgi:hypothetical protein
MLHSDFGTGLVYYDTGQVLDPVTGVQVGQFSASGQVAPDSSINRIFVLGQTAAQSGTTSYTIASFDENTYAAVSSLTVSGFLGVPIEMVRCGGDCLAVLTFNSDTSEYNGPFETLYLIHDATFVSAKSALQISLEGGKPPVPGVATRWKPVTRSVLRQKVRALKAN